MLRTHAVLLVALLGLLASPGALAVTDWNGSAPEDLHIHLVTSPPGHRDPSAWYGHSGILVEDDATGESAYYGYRLDSVGSTWRAFKTGIGGSIMHLEEMEFADIVADYASQGRAVRNVELLLAPEARHDLAVELSADAASQAELPYHWLDDNCSTRVRDYVDAAVGGRLRAATEPASGPSIREATRPFVDHVPVQATFMRFFGSDDVDKPTSEWDLMFLPLRLEASLVGFQVEDGDGPRALAGPPVVVLEAEEPYTPPPQLSVTGPILAVTTLLAVAVAVLGWGASIRVGAARAFAVLAMAWGLLLTGPALLLAFVSTGAVGSQYAGNENLLLLPLTVLVFIPLGWRALRDRRRAWDHLRYAALAHAALASLALLLKPLPWMDQVNGPGIALLLPLHLGFAVGASLAGMGTPRAPQDAPRAQEGSRPRVDTAASPAQEGNPPGQRT